ncbi:MAG: transposase [Candidatus Cloacimonetes bacterium]|nr:transposase [Candidatus Cloacimonadota bacterium]
MEKSDDLYPMIDWEGYAENYAELFAAVKAGSRIMIIPHNSQTGEPVPLELVTRFPLEKEPPSLYKEEEAKMDEPVMTPPQMETALAEPSLDDQPEELDLVPQDKELLSCMNEAQLLSQFCETAIELVNESEAKLEAWRQINQEYNAGRLLPELYLIRGKRSERSLRKWVDAYLENNRDMFALIHKSKNRTRGRKVTFMEQQFLLKLLLSPQKIKIGSAVATVKAFARLGSLDSPSSIPTLRRWCQDYRKNNLAIWTQARHGSKAVAEEIVKTIIRDNDLLEVGQVWVADGHTLAFDIISPKTGKPVRMTMIMVFDWASRYPVGASLAYTEDSQHIQLAFRNAFLNYQGVPKAVYLDNGKAFRSKLFNEKWEGHDLSSELAGIFPRLGINVVFAESYNAKAKIIERFFKTFQERFERFVSSFRGASVADKPATLMRNEKWARKMYEAQPPTLEEAMRMIGFYVRYMYGEEPHSGLGGKTPWQVFSSHPVPDERRIEAGRLNFLMLTTLRKTLRNNGIVINKMQYWNLELIEHMGKEVLIRYDPSDARWILVYDLLDNFICQAELRKAVDPFIHLDLENPVSVAEVKKEYKAIKRHQKQIADRTRLTLKQTQEVVDAYIKPLILAPDEANPTFIQPPAIKAPEPGPEQVMEVLEKQAMQKLPNRLEQNKPKQIDDDGEIKPKEKTFEEMLRFIGIK